LINRSWREGLRRPLPSRVIVYRGLYTHAILVRKLVVG